MSFWTREELRRIVLLASLLTCRVPVTALLHPRQQRMHQWLRHLLGQLT